LFSKDKKDLKNGFKAELYYQIFIEPKGNEFIGDDGTFKTGKEGWKEQFLEEISEKYGFEKVIKAENPNYRLVGLPFFNKDHNSNFKKEYEMVVNK
jgi:type III restriction enzyme